MRRWAFPLGVAFCFLPSIALAQQTVHLVNQIWGHILVETFDQATGGNVNARCYLTDSSGHSWAPSGAITYVKPPEQNFIALGRFQIELPPGTYRLRVERGTEYRPYEKQIEIKAGEILHQKVELQRWINMNARGWYSADLHNHRDWREMPEILLSEDLNLAPTTTDWVWGSRTISLQPPASEQPIRRVDATHAYSIFDTEIERTGLGTGSIDLLGLKRAIQFDGYELAPPNTTFTQEAHEQAGYVDAEKITWRDGAALAALGQVDFVGLVYNSFSPLGVQLSGGNVPQDKPEYGTPGGLMYLAMDFYYRLLNCGFNLPVSGGTASGVKPMPLGYNRVYAHLRSKFSYQDWFRELKAGRSFATNGPMLFLSVDGHEPGETIQIASDARGAARRLKAHAEVFSRGTLDRLEILWKGKPVRQVTAPPDTQELTADITIPVTQSGWLVARTFEKPRETVHFAHTSPVYVRLGNDPGIVPEDAEYFVRLMKEEIKYFQNLSEFRTATDQQAMINMFKKALAIYERLATSGTQ